MGNINRKLNQLKSPRGKFYNSHRGSIFWRWTVQIIKWTTGLTLLFAAVGAGYQVIANAIDERIYPPQGQLVDVGGHHLHIYCTGEGEPTVILEMGLNGTTTMWSLIQPKISKFARVCSYDRAGYGWSQPGSTPRTSQKLAEELHALLENAGIKSPYLMVGYSLGGYVVRQYADQFRNQVAGIVLINSADPEDDVRLPGFKEKRKTGLQYFTMLRSIAPLGLLRLSMNLNLLPGIELLSDLPSNKQPMTKSLLSTSKPWGTAYDEIVVWEQSSDQIRSTNSLGNTPLAIMTDGANCLSNDEYMQNWMKLQAGLTRLSSNSTYIVTQKCDHHIPFKEPELVIDAVQQVLEKAKLQKQKQATNVAVP